MNNSSLNQINQDRHQTVQTFFNNLPKTLPTPEIFNKILGEAASLRIIAKIPPAVFAEMYQRFGAKAWTISNFPIEQGQEKYYIYSGKTWFGPEKAKTFQTLKWQIFDYLKRILQHIVAEQEYLKKREARRKELNAVYDEMLVKMQAESISDADLLNILNSLEQKYIIKKVGEEEKENRDTFYFRTRTVNQQDGSREWVHLFYQYSGPRDPHCLERQIYNDLRTFKRILLEKIHQKSEKIRQERIQHQGNQFQQNQGGPRVVSTGGSRKCVKAWHTEAIAKGELGEKNAKQRKEEKKRRKWEKNRAKTEAFQDKYVEDIGSSDGEK